MGWRWLIVPLPADFCLPAHPATPAPACSWFERPPAELSLLTGLRALYTDYNEFGAMGSDAATQAALRCESLRVCLESGGEGGAGVMRDGTHRFRLRCRLSAFWRDIFGGCCCCCCRVALGPLLSLQALGLSHSFLDSWPQAVESLTKLRVLYLGKLPALLTAGSSWLLTMLWRMGLGPACWNTRDPLQPTAPPALTHAHLPACLGRRRRRVQPGHVAAAALGRPRALLQRHEHLVPVRAARELLPEASRGPPARNRAD